jgi:hypothetical protein
VQSRQLCWAHAWQVSALLGTRWVAVRSPHAHAAATAVHHTASNQRAATAPTPMATKSSQCPGHYQWHGCPTGPHTSAGPCEPAHQAISSGVFRLPRTNQEDAPRWKLGDADDAFPPAAARPLRRYLAPLGQTTAFYCWTCGHPACHSQLPGFSWTLSTDERSSSSRRAAETAKGRSLLGGQLRQATPAKCTER